MFENCSKTSKDNLKCSLDISLHFDILVFLVLLLVMKNVSYKNWIILRNTY